MALHVIKKGLDLPIVGKVEQIISEGNVVKRVAVLGDDYVGMKPTMAVQVGDVVRHGQVLFIDKKIEGVKYTSPGAGRVVEINRGEKRHFLSVVIELEGNDEIAFNAYSDSELGKLKRQEIIEQLLESGLWTALRARPFSKIALPETIPHSIFITAIDTNPLGPSMEKVVAGNKPILEKGLKIISKLTEGKLFFCKDVGADIPVNGISNLLIEEFTGPHPAGNVGTHIHFLDPVSRKKTVWYINIQDVIAIGHLFGTGRLNVERVVSIAGPEVKHPRLIRTRLGASTEDLVAAELKEGEEKRVISGPLLSGRHATGHVAYLGRYHQQISVIAEEKEKYFVGWLMPGINMFSITRTCLSKLIPGKKFSFNTSLYGGKRAIVPIGLYEKVMPLDIEPTYLLRALAAKDVEEAEALGCLELDEEDLALCTFVCPSKQDYGPMLRNILTLIEKEG
jgi:Na+-transporting NADH:ubiquinone oxidoreductase subunit A